MIDRKVLTYGDPALEEALTFTVNFPTPLLAQARRFSEQHSSKQKAQSVYINTLAVYAVSFYCDCMSIKTDLSASSSWNPALQALMNTAELITAKGALECRPILPGCKTCYIPPEIGAGTVGCCVVEVDTAKNQATLLGFTSVISEGLLPLKALQPLEALVDRLIEVEPAVVSEAARPEPDKLKAAKRQLARRQPTRLSAWLENIFEAEWQPSSAVLTASYRGLLEEDSAALEAGKYRAKALRVGGALLALIVQVSRVSSGLEILLSVHPGLDCVLPAGLALELLNDQFEVDMSMTAGANDNYLSMTFQIEPDEAFSVRVAIADQSVMERFIS